MRKMFLIMSCVIMTGFMFQSCKQNDSKLLDSVQKELVEKYNSASISSSVKDGIATLNGIVESETQKIAIENDIAKVSGVKKVVNNITIREKENVLQQSAASVDATMKSALETTLKAAGFNDVKVDVTNGEIALSGNLKRSDLTKVMQMANALSPKKVTNNITLK